MGDVIQVIWWFIIESTINLSVDVQGFADVMKIKSLPVVSAVTAIDLEEETIILELHQCLLSNNNKNISSK